MKIISWNIRGLNGAQKHEIVWNMIRDQRPDFLMLQKTKMKRDLVKRISFSKNFYCVASDSDRGSGGFLTLYDTRAFKLTTLHSSTNSLLCEVFHFQSNESWLILNLYAPNSKKERNFFWTKLLGILFNCNLNKGIIMGDFNSPLSDVPRVSTTTNVQVTYRCILKRPVGTIVCFML